MKKPLVDFIDKTKPDHEAEIFIESTIGFCEAKCLGSKKPVRAFIAPQPVYIAADPQSFKEVLVSKTDCFEKGAEQALMKTLLGEGLVTSNGERWEASRQALKASFSSKNLSSGMCLAFTEIFKAVGKLAQQIREQQVITVDVHEFVGKLAMQMTCTTLFQARLSDDEASKLYEACKVAHEWLSIGLWSPQQLEDDTDGALAYQRAVYDVHEVIDRLSVEGGGLIDDLRPLVDRFGKSVVYDEVLTLLVAGFETTATSGAFALYAAAQDYKLADWIAEEANQHLDNSMDYNPLYFKEAPRISAFLNESLRLFPSAWWFARRATQDVTISGTKIEAGASIYLCPWVLHRQPYLWTEPQEFKPERWLSSKVDKFAYMPFGTGSRSCIGRHLAYCEIAAIVSAICTSFNIYDLNGLLHDGLAVGGITLGVQEPGLMIGMEAKPTHANPIFAMKN